MGKIKVECCECHNLCDEENGNLRHYKNEEEFVCIDCADKNDYCMRCGVWPDAMGQEDSLCLGCYEGDQSERE